MPTLATLALCAGVAACANRADGPADDREWNMEGTIAGIEAGAGATRLMVDLAAGGAAEPGRVALLVSPDTEVLVQRADGTSAAGGAADLAVGARIRARHTGEEMRSLPPQYRATHVLVLPGG
jgi:hypothetical protein